MPLHLEPKKGYAMTAFTSKTKHPEVVVRKEVQTPDEAIRAYEKKVLAEGEALRAWNKKSWIGRILRRISAI